MIEWHTGEPPENALYLVAVSINKRIILSADYWEEPIGFVDWHDDVLAWAILPEPWKGGKNETNC